MRIRYVLGSSVVAIVMTLTLVPPAQAALVHGPWLWEPSVNLGVASSVQTAPDGAWVSVATASGTPGSIAGRARLWRGGTLIAETGIVYSYSSYFTVWVARPSGGIGTSSGDYYSQGRGFYNSGGSYHPVNAPESPSLRFN